MRALLALVLLLGAPNAGAATAEQDLPPGWTNPSNLAFDEAGQLWLTLDGTWAIARWNMTTDETQLYPLPTPKRDTYDSMGAIRFDGRGGLWTSTQTHLHHLLGNGTIESYELPEWGYLPGDVYLAPDGRVWTTLVDKNALYELDTATGNVRTHRVPDARGGPLEFEEASNGTVYLSTTYADTVATFDPGSGNVRLAPSFVKSPVGLAAQGDKLWVAEMGQSSITLAYPTSGDHSRYPTSASPSYSVSGPSGILVHPDGSVWFAEHFADRVARLDVAKGYLHEYVVASAPGTDTQRVALGPDGDVWFAEFSKHKIGRANYTNEPVAVYANSTASVRAGDEVHVEAQTLRPLEASSPDENITTSVARGTTTGESTQWDVTIRTTRDLAPGTYRVLLSARDADDARVITGKYVELTVLPPSADTPISAYVSLVALAIALLIARRRA